MSVSQQWGPHLTIIHDVLDLLNPTPPPPRPGPNPLLVTPGGHHWRPVQTCSLEDLTQAILFKQYIKFLKTHLEIMSLSWCVSTARLLC